mmetsp:Transcript_26908/g.62923  ORF Transcript_26908/g.62923 Transcript_26908/m.62923 type:complete len:100 (-) Transcript_26908:67-366(-)
MLGFAMPLSSISMDSNGALIPLSASLFHSICGVSTFIVPSRVQRSIIPLPDKNLQIQYYCGWDDNESGSISTKKQNCDQQKQSVEVNVASNNSHGADSQ